MSSISEGSEPVISFPFVITENDILFHRSMMNVDTKLGSLQKKALISISTKQARFRFEFNTYMDVLFFIDFLPNLEERVAEIGCA